MRLRICAEIEGLFLLKDRVEVNNYPFEFAIYSKDSRHFISVTKQVVDYLEYAPKIYSQGGIVHFEDTKPEIYKDMVEWLFYIEAMGAFNFEVSKIHVDELEVSWIIEKEQEKGLIPITSMKRSREKKKAQKYVSSKNLSNLVLFRRMLPEAHIPFSYYRQGKAFFDNNNFYFAFINYFMMLEFCFANGKFKKNDVIANFSKSVLLKLCVLATITMLQINDNGEGNYDWLIKECNKRHKELGFESVIYLLVEYRGLLSHASEQSKNYLFDDAKLRPLAFVTSIICFFLCGYIQVYSCSSEESKNKLMLERIKELEEKIKER